MSVDYEAQIVEMLSRRTPELAQYPHDDWGGPGELLCLYERTRGEERGKLTAAMGNVLGKPDVTITVKADLVHIITSLDIAGIDSAVMRLSQTPQAQQQPLECALRKYFAHYELSTSHF